MSNNIPTRAYLLDGTSYSLPYDLALSKGIIENANLVVKFGYNKDIDSAAEETVWAVGGEWTPTTGAEIVDITSSSLNDVNTTGTGAWLVLITGIADDYSELSEYVNLNGTNTVQTVNEYRYINRVAVAFSGSGQKNDGNITFNQTTSGTSLAYIPAGESITQQAVYTVPLGYQAYLAGIFLSVGRSSGGSSPDVEFELYSFNAKSNTRYGIASFDLDEASQSDVNIPQPFANPTDEQSTLFLNARTNTNNTKVFGRFYMRLVKL